MGDTELLSSSIGSFLERPVQVIDVGCRWGPNDKWADLVPYVNVIGFDPDSEECASLNRQYSHIGQVKFVPLALGPVRGKAHLHVAKDPACSSMFPPDERALRNRPSLVVATEVGVSEIDVVTLDEWLAEEHVAEVDFIKVDTQGSELGVLEGAAATLQGVRAIELEVEFNPIYKGQPLFSDVDRFMRSHGFVLWRLADLVHYSLPNGWSRFSRPEVQFFDDSPTATFTGWGGQLFWANAFFVAEDLAYPDLKTDDDQALRDVFVCGALGFWDLAAACAQPLLAKSAPELISALRRLLSSALAP